MACKNEMLSKTLVDAILKYFGTQLFIILVLNFEQVS